MNPQISSDIQKLPDPNQRILIRGLIILLILSGTTITVLFSSRNKNTNAELRAKDDEIRYWKKLSDEKNHIIDSLKLKDYLEIVEDYKRLQHSLQWQDSLKSKLRSKAK